MEEKLLDSRRAELSKKYGINFDNLEKEQIKLSKDLTIKDKVDFSLVDKFGAFENIFIQNKILSCFVVLDKNLEILDKVYVLDKIHFPYLPGFRNYRELPAMLKAFEKSKYKPNLVFVSAQGIIHQRLGLASHFGLSTGIPTIGVSNFITDCEFKSEDNSEIKRNGKLVGKVLISKKESNPIYISPGNNISVKSAYELSKRFIIPPHKMPEPLNIVSKYAKSVRKEIIS
ncbi:MAG: endonuclease V [Nanoarchaeota archaeon]